MHITPITVQSNQTAVDFAIFLNCFLGILTGTNKQLCKDQAGE